MSEREFGPKNIYHPTRIDILKYHTLPQIGSTIKEIWGRVKNPKNILQGSLTVPTIAASGLLVRSAFAQEPEAGTCTFYQDEGFFLQDENGDWILCDDLVVAGSCIVFPREGPWRQHQAGDWLPCDSPQVTEAPEPDVTPEPTTIPTPEPRPTATPELPPGARYDSWPAEIAAAMTRLVLPDNVRLVRLSAPPADQPGCVIACWNPNQEIYLIIPPRGNAAPELVNMAYELGHAHKDAARMREGISGCDPGGYAETGCFAQTKEYTAFINTLNTANARLRGEAKPELTHPGGPLALFNNLFAGYILGDPNFRNAPASWGRWVPNTYQYPEIVSFMNKWARK